MGRTTVEHEKNVCLATQNFLIDMIASSETEMERSLRIKDAIDAYTRNLKVVESDLDDGVSVKAKNGQLVIEIPKRKL